MAFNKQKHIRYWRMCANVLPDAYQSSDASRMFLGFFTVAALDLLDVLNNDNLDKPIITHEDRQIWIEWIYSCQVPDGAGFRGFTGTDLADRRSRDNCHWDPGNLPNTFFALATLLILGDDLARVKRNECIAWLPKLQRIDGSFGEILGPEDGIEGGRDLRYCCCAAGIAYILQDPKQTLCRPFFDEQRLIDYIVNCQDYNGGFGESPLREPHSGLNYCAVATLELLGRLNSPGSARAKAALSESDFYIRWLVDRQTSVLYEEERADDEEKEEEEEEEKEGEDGQPATNGATFSSHPMYYSEPSRIIGFNGRSNKIADTCYCFWNSGALAILESLQLADLRAVRCYLLQKVQHLIGGFAKGPDSPPDVMHSYLGLAALALYGESGIKSLDPALCISKSAAANLHKVVWRL